MVKYKFFYDVPNSNYRCIVEDNYIYRCLTIEKAKEQIRNLQFNNIRLDNNTMVLKNKEVELVVEDVDKCNLLIDLLATNFKLVNDAIKKHKDKPVTNVFPLNIIKNKELISTVLVASILGSIAIGSVFNHPTKTVMPTPLEGYEISNDSKEQVVEPLVSYKIEEKYEVNTKEELPEVDDIPEEIKNTITFNHGNKIDTITYKNAYDKWYDMVSYSAKKWGLDPDHLMAVLAQESAGVLTNLMQFNFNSFKGGKLTSYNFITNRYVTYFFTDDPNYVTNNKYIVVRSKDLTDAQTNIDMGALFLRTNIDSYNNIMAGTLCYNQGSGNMKKIFAETYLKTGKDMDEVLSDYSTSVFYDYTYITGAGDKDYLYNVFGFYPKDTISLMTIEDGKVCENKYNIVNEQNEKALNY